MPLITTDVDLERREPRDLGGVDAAQHVLDAMADAGQPGEDLGSSDGTLTVMRSRPAARSAAALSASSSPLVVSARSAMPSIAREHLDQHLDLRAQQRLAAGEAELAHAERSEDARQTRDLFEAQDLGLGQELVDVARRHAEAATEVAAVDDRDAQILERAAEEVAGDRGDADSLPALRS